MLDVLVRLFWELHGVTCREASALASRSLDEKLGLRDRFRLRSHQAVCRWCRRYAAHLKLMRRVLRGRPGSMGIQKMPPAARQRILQALSKKGDC